MSSRARLIAVTRQRARAYMAAWNAGALLRTTAIQDRHLATVRALARRGHHGLSQALADTWDAHTHPPRWLVERVRLQNALADIGDAA